VSSVPFSSVSLHMPLDNRAMVCPTLNAAADK